MTGQEERDVLFARLFGLTAVVQSGLLVRETSLVSSASTSTLSSSLDGYKETILQLVALGERRSFLRESAWWTAGLAIDALMSSKVSWKDEAFDVTFQTIFSDNDTWTPEKVAITLKLQAAHPKRDWAKILTPTWKNAELLSTGNLLFLARILKVNWGTRSKFSWLIYIWFKRNQILKAVKGLKQPSATGSPKSTLCGMSFWINFSSNEHQAPQKRLSRSFSEL